MIADDFVEIGLVLHAVERFVGPNEHVRALPDFLIGTCPETACRFHAHHLRPQAGGLKFFLQKRQKRFRAEPIAARTAADQNFVLDDFVDRPVEHLFEQRLALLDVLREDFVDHRPIDAFVFHRHLAGHHDAHDRLAAASAGAAGFVQDDIGPGGGGDVLAKLLVNFLAAGGVFAGGRADLHANPIVHRPLPQRFLRLGSQLPRNF